MGISENSSKNEIASVGRNAETILLQHQSSSYGLAYKCLKEAIYTKLLQIYCLKYV
jgi:hypothetical protein